HAHPRGLAGLLITYEDVEGAVRVAGHEVRGGAVEGDDSPVGGEGRAGAEVVPLEACRAHAHPRGGDAPGLVEDAVPVGVAVADEDVVGAVGVSREEVRGRALEDHEAAVGRDRRGATRTVRLATRRVDTHPDRRDPTRLVEDAVSVRVAIV